MRDVILEGGNWFSQRENYIQWLVTTWNTASVDKATDFWCIMDINKIEVVSLIYNLYMSGTRVQLVYSYCSELSLIVSLASKKLQRGRIKCKSPRLRFMRLKLHSSLLKRMNWMVIHGLSAHMQILEIVLCVHSRPQSLRVFWLFCLRKTRRLWGTLRKRSQNLAMLTW